MATGALKSGVRMRMKMWGGLGSPIAAGRPFAVTSSIGVRQGDHRRTGRIRKDDSSVPDREGNTAALLAWAGEDGIRQ